VRVDPPRLFKRPRSPRQWPTRAYVLVVVLVFAVALVVALAIVVRPSEFPPAEVPDQWAAEAAVIGGGALFFALVATAIATVAYINSTEKPSLGIVDVDYLGQSAAVGDWVSATADEAEPNLIRADLQWSFALRIRNNGPVAARFVAVQVKLAEGAFFYGRHLAPWVGVSWQGRTVGNTSWNDTTDAVRWEGGVDVLIHPSWEYDIPQLGPTHLTLYGAPLRTAFEFQIEVIADDVKPFSQTYTIRAQRNK
jgi:hypothetical protein